MKPHETAHVKAWLAARASEHETLAATQDDLFQRGYQAGQAAGYAATARWLDDHAALAVECPPRDGCRVSQAATARQRRLSPAPTLLAPFQCPGRGGRLPALAGHRLAEGYSRAVRRRHWANRRPAPDRAGACADASPSLAEAPAAAKRQGVRLRVSEPMQPAVDLGQHSHAALRYPEGRRAF